jgi:hypothetical protein
MKAVFDKVMEKLEKDLAANEAEAEPLKQHAIGTELVKAAYWELFQNGDFIDAYLSSDIRAYVPFNKENIPRLLSKYAYHRLCYDFENHKLCSTREDHKLFCLQQLGKIYAFFTAQRDFIAYWYKGGADRDLRLFSQFGVHEPPVIIQEFETFYHENTMALQVALLLAYEQYRKLLRAELDDSVSSEAKSRHKVTWTKNIIDLAEQVVGQYEYGTTDVDGKPATQDFLIQLAAATYSNITAEQLTRNVRGIATRSKGPTAHHEAIMTSMIKRDDRLLDGKRKKSH